MTNAVPPQTGRGRGLGKGWIAAGFKPKDCPLKPEDIINASKFEDDDVSEIENIVIEDEKETCKADINDLGQQLASEFTLEDSNSRKNSAENEPLWADILDERPAINPVTFSLNSLQKDVQPESIQSNSLSILEKAVLASEFVPNTHTEAVEDLYEGDDTSAYNDGDMLDMLRYMIMCLTDTPSSFDIIIEDLTLNLHACCTSEETLKNAVDMIVEQAIDSPNFCYSAVRLCSSLYCSKALDLENGVTFKKIFFKRCQEEFIKVKAMTEDTDNLNENIGHVCNTSLFFGELLVNMKINDTVIPIFINSVEKFVDMFLLSANEKLVSTLVQLLKLVGPELDKTQSEENEKMFDKLKEFYFNPPEGLSSSLKERLWRLYKLRTRNWDIACTPQPSPNIPKGDNDIFLYSTKQHHQQQQQQHHPQQTEEIDWNDYYTGDDTEIYSMIPRGDDDEEDEFESAFEDFLRTSGQI